MKIEIRGRGWRGGVVKLTATAAGLHVRVDDDWNPELWFEIVIDDHAVHFARVAAQMCGENAEVWLSPCVTDWGERCPETVAAQTELTESCKRLRQVRLFDQMWDLMAVLSQCDALGSAEYHRVLNEWIAKGRPMPIRPFISEHANKSSADS